MEQKVRDAADKVLQMEIDFGNDPSERNKINLCQAKIELESKLQMDDRLWHQKANLKWVKDGENTKFFHQ